PTPLLNDNSCTGGRQTSGGGSGAGISFSFSDVRRRPPFCWGRWLLCRLVPPESFHPCQSGSSLDGQPCIRLRRRRICASFRRPSRSGAERRVGKECRSLSGPSMYNKKETVGMISERDAVVSLLV